MRARTVAAFGALAVFITIVGMPVLFATMGQRSLAEDRRAYEARPCRDEAHEVSGRVECRVDQEGTLVREGSTATLLCRCRR